MSVHKLKLRIAIGKITAMGPGKAELLQLIVETGSISAAAKRMNMSYGQAWKLVDTMNRSFKQPLVVGVIGGNRGGGACVTEFGQSMLESYWTLLLKINELAISEIDAITSNLCKP